MKSRNYRTIVTITVVCDTCTIHPEYHDGRVKSIMEFLASPIGRINRMSNVSAGSLRSDSFCTDFPYDPTAPKSLFDV